MKQSGVLASKKIAIVCDWIQDWWGAELVLSHILEIFPHADIYTSVFFQNNNPLFYAHKVCSLKEAADISWPKIVTSFIQKLPFFKKRHKLSGYFRPLAFESFDLWEYDIVISSSSAESKGIITKVDTLHICYCHTPTRYFWSHYHEYRHMWEFGIFNLGVKLLAPKLIQKLRIWDFYAAQRPDFFIANSHNTASRIKKYYARESRVIYPGIDIPKKLQKNKKTQDYYLALGRCIPYKKFDLLVDAFNENGKKLICITNTKNTLFEKLQKKSKKNIEWKLQISREETQKLLSQAKAFVFPPEEDFGIVPLEAMIYGTPIIAYGKWWATETVQDGKTGVFFQRQDTESLNEAITRFETLTFDIQYIQAHAKTFAKERFQEEFIQFLEEKYRNI